MFGIAGNVLSLVVLGRDRTIRRTTGFLLQMLAVADTAFLVSCLAAITLDTALKFRYWLPEDVQHGSPYIYAYSYPVASITWSASMWMVVVLTADRYIAICRPLHAAQYSTLPRLRRAVAVLWVLALAYRLPRFFEVKVVEIKMGHVSRWDILALNGSDVVSDNSTMADTLLNLNQNSTQLESGHVLTWTFTAMSANRVYQFVYNQCLSFVVLHLLPLVALVFFNQRLVRALHDSNRLRRHRIEIGSSF